MEKLDLFDKDRIALNKIHIRGDIKKDGEYTIAVGIFVIDNNGRILTTLRDPKKNIYPSLWENTVGNVLSGESSIDGAVRELFEETGINCFANELILIDEKRESDFFMDTYLLKRDIDLKDIVLQEGETVDAKLVTKDGFLEMINNGIVVKHIGNRFKRLLPKIEKYL